LKVSKKSESSPSWNGGTKRPTSPREAGSSTLITSAPRSASWSVAQGPAPNCSSATIRTSASGSERPHLPEQLHLLQQAARLDRRVEDDVLGARLDVGGGALGAGLGRARDGVTLDRVGRELRRVAAREVLPRLLDGAADERRQDDGGGERAAAGLGAQPREPLREPLGRDPDRDPA